MINQIRNALLEKASFDEQCHQWNFSFSGGWVLQVSAPWRVVANAVTVLGSQDDGQQFGLPKPLSAEEEINNLLLHRPVELMSFNELGDLVVDFGAIGCLEVFNESSGYEGWVLNGPESICIVAQGGGNVIGFEEG